MQRNQKNKRMIRPFVFGVAVDTEHFIGRQQEIENLSSNLIHGINTILIAPRRWGKTSLVNHVAENIHDKDVKIIHLDIFSCRNEYDFYNVFAAAILQQTSSRIEEWKQYAQEFLTRLVPKISFSAEPNQEYSISLGITPKTHTPEEILNLPEIIAEKKGWHLAICIDEFQQIGEFPESLSVQKRMRTVWQHQKNVSYCLYGSKKHMMSVLFQQKSKPFYKFGKMMYLNVIPTTEWIPYLQGRFKLEGKILPKDIAIRICDAVENHSSYVQELAYDTLLCTKGTETTDEDFAQAFRNLLDDNTALFTEKTERLTTYQLNFLRAILDDVHDGFSKSDIRDTYNLGSPTNIVRIKDALIEKEIIDITDKGVFFADPILMHWLRRKL